MSCSNCECEKCARDRSTPSLPGKPRDEFGSELMDLGTGRVYPRSSTVKRRWRLRSPVYRRGISAKQAQGIAAQISRYVSQGGRMDWTK